MANISFTMHQDVPFKKLIQRSFVALIAKKCKKFVAELGEKGGGQGWTAPDKGDTKGAAVQVGQYQKYTQGPDGVAALQQKARQVSEKEAAEGGDDKDGVKKRNHQKRLHTTAETH